MFTLQRLILEVAPVQKVLNKLRTLEDWPDISCQQCLLDTIISVGIYQPPPTWYQQLMKLVIDDIESRDAELCDEIVSFAIEQKIKKNDENRTYFAVYELPDTTEMVKCRILASHNEVGLRIWEAGLFLAEVILSCPFLINSKNVVELGAGVGITGLLLAKAQIPFESYTLTDYATDVLDNLQFNVNLNFCQHEKYIPNLQIEYLDWAKLSDRELKYSTVDSIIPLQATNVILAADCVYSEDLCDSLLHVIKELLSDPPSNSHTPVSDANDTVNEAELFIDTTTNNTSNSTPPFGIKEKLHNNFALLACTIRQLTTYQYLLCALSNTLGIICYDITDWAFSVSPRQVYYYDNRTDIRMLYVTCTSV